MIALFLRRRIAPAQRRGLGQKQKFAELVSPNQENSEQLFQDPSVSINADMTCFETDNFYGPQEPRSCVEYKDCFGGRSYERIAHRLAERFILPQMSHFS